MGVEWGGPPNFELRRLMVLVAVALAVLIALAIHEGVISDEPPPSTTPDILTIHEGTP